MGTLSIFPACNIYVQLLLPQVFISFLHLIAPPNPCSVLFEMQADSGNNLIRCIIVSTGVVSTLAGQMAVAGFNNGVGTTATFNLPMGIALDAAGTFAVIVSSMQTRWVHCTASLLLS